MDPDPGGPNACASGGTGSFYHPWFLLFCEFFWTFYLCKCTSKSNKQENFLKIFFTSWWSMTKLAGSWSGSISRRHGSADPYPHQHVMDPEHFILALSKLMRIWIQFRVQMITSMRIWMRILIFNRCWYGSWFLFDADPALDFNLIRMRIRVP